MSSDELKERFTVDLEPKLDDYNTQLEAELKHIEVNKQEAKRDCDMKIQSRD